jgi:HEPN domain-containing protein
MPPESSGPGVAREWMTRARSNLALAKAIKPAETLWEDLCFNVQQAAEKAVKAVLISRGVEYPKTHDLRDLLSLADPTGQTLGPQIWNAADLNDYAVSARYPGAFEPVTEEEYRRALETAEAVVRWAAAVVGEDLR